MCGWWKSFCHQRIRAVTVSTFHLPSLILLFWFCSTSAQWNDEVMNSLPNFMQKNTKVFFSVSGRGSFKCLLKNKNHILVFLIAVGTWPHTVMDQFALIANMKCSKKHFWTVRTKLCFDFLQPLSMIKNSVNKTYNFSAPQQPSEKKPPTKQKIQPNLQVVPKLIKVLFCLQNI